jgi:uncharacterized protein YjbI with pentapeptide repeats
MANPEHVAKLKEGVEAWNVWRETNRGIRPDLRNVKLRDAKLHAANLMGAQLIEADLRGADLTESHLSGANLSNADLSGAALVYGDLNAAVLLNANLNQVSLGNTLFSDVDLSTVIGLEDCEFLQPCPVSTSTLEMSYGRIPHNFLQGCGLQPWEILQSKMYNPEISPADIAEIQNQIFQERSKGYFFGGIFISYSRDNEAFVKLMYKRLVKEGANVWLDTKNLIAGDLEHQVQKAIRMNDIVLLVLSESSVKSDWVDAELEWTLKQEKDKNKSVVCPVALDDSWKETITHAGHWRQLKKKVILDFSEWENEKAFEENITKLLEGLKVNY